MKNPAPKVPGSLHFRIRVSAQSIPFMLTLFEYQTAPFDWNPRRLAALARLNRAQGDDILRAVWDKNGPAVQATQYVGVVRLGRDTIQVLPKIYKHSDNAASEATRNLLHLLANRH